MSAIDVMRKALEALDSCTPGDYSTGHVIGPSYDEKAVGEAIIALRAELERLEAVEPVAFMWQHDETGRVGFIDPWQRQNGFEANNPRCKVVHALYTAPIAPAIPALTIEEVAAGAPEFADVPKYGPAYLAGAHWAYTLAAARTGARIIKADTLQELADDARQIGLEY